MVGLELVAPILDDQPVVVLVGAAGPCLLLCLSDLARTQQSDALIVGEGPVRLKFVVKLDLAHVSSLQLILTWMSMSWSAALISSNF